VDVAFPKNLDTIIATMILSLKTRLLGKTNNFDSNAHVLDSFKGFDK
jgi:hypothetical protein